MAKTICITGASSGIGKATALLFLEKGWNVIATMRSPEKEKELENSDQMLVTQLDVQDSSSIENAIQAGIKKFGGIDVLVNNAGYAVVGVFESSTQEQVKRQFEVNVFGLMNVTRAILPHLRARGKGTLVNISSYGGLVSLPTGSIYNSTKFAVEGFSESLSHELANLNIAVKLIEPGSIATNFRSNIDPIKSGIPDYEALTSSFWGRHAQLTEHLKKASAEEAAAVIFTAVTDESKQLRYPVGDDARFFIERKFTMQEPEYFTMMHQYIHH